MSNCLSVLPLTGIEVPLTEFANPTLVRTGLIVSNGGGPTGSPNPQEILYGIKAEDLGIVVTFRCLERQCVRLDRARPWSLSYSVVVAPPLHAAPFCFLPLLNCYFSCLQTPRVTFTGSLVIQHRNEFPSSPSLFWPSELRPWPCYHEISLSLSNI
ncbi:hypothetical protein CRG98_035404 [Punica granatum]|uniref:Uncharacterized protein n=1 Tax=Punica granatum TaxID=22663 RepID=A0A2I0IJM4_PUNGR|nr:hypothetical protein CRG98_035404 [Punica granatum]